MTDQMSGRASTQPPVSPMAVGFTAFGWGLEAGIRGNVSLIRGDLTAHAGGHLDVIAGADGRPELLKGSLYQKLSYDLSFLSGNLSYFYTYPTIRFCKVLGLSISPCGFKLARKEKSFQSWPGSHLGPFDVFNKNDPAFELSLACWPLGCESDEPAPEVCGVCAVSPVASAAESIVPKRIERFILNPPTVNEFSHQSCCAHLAPRSDMNCN